MKKKEFGLIELIKQLFTPKNTEMENKKAMICFRFQLKRNLELSGFDGGER